MFEETSEIELINYLKMLNIGLNNIDSVETFGYRKHIKTGSYILNIDRDIHDETKGTHWTCFFCFNGYCLYIDSYGFAPPEKIKRWIDKNGDHLLIYNPHQIQSLESLACGYYCIYFLYHMNQRKREMRSAKACHRILNEILEPFDYNNFHSNDTILKIELEKIFI